MSLLSSSNFFFFFLVFIFLHSCSSFAASLPTALLLPITKDHSTLQYTTIIEQRTPMKPTKLFVDLGFSFSWVNCQTDYNYSTTYQPIFCGTSLCTSLKSLACSYCYEPPSPGCANNSCALYPENSVTRKADLTDAIIDAIALRTTDGRNPGRLALISDFVSSCAHTFLLKGLAKGVVGVAALGRSNFSLPAQISTTFSSPYLFALCLSGSPSAPGVAFLGTAGPYVFLPQQVDLSKSLTYTPLILNPVSDTVVYLFQPSYEYFIGVTAVKVNGKAVQLNETLLTINNATGFGGTKISTVVPYTTMESSIYKAFTEAFVSEAAALNLTTTKPVKPFSVCFPVDEVGSTLVGPAVPTVDLVMDQKEGVFWRIFGANSMVRRKGKGKEYVWCLGFVDGGKSPRTSIVIGGQQMEDNLLQFDVGSKRFGFSSSLLLKHTTCSDFNFTTSSMN